MSESDPLRRKSLKRQRLVRQTRASLLWGFAFFALSHAVLQFATQGFMPQLRDPEFGYKLGGLRKRLAEEPDRPLLILLGTSRTGQGFRVGKLPELQTREGRTPLVFNFSQVGSGPLAEMVTLRRLLDRGIRPDWLAIEILPPMLGRPIDACGNPRIGVDRLTWSDVAILRQYAPEPIQLVRRWWEAQLAPWHAHRFPIMNYYASDWLPWRLRIDHWKAIDAWGWSDLGRDSDPPWRDPRMLKLARDTYEDELKIFTIAEMQDRALRDLIAMCRREKIPAIFYLMPEGRIFQSWYPRRTLKCINEYLTRISREYSVPIVDARRWIGDEYFFDSHHLDRQGATQFVRRFGVEVLPALVQGRLGDIKPVLVPGEQGYPEEPNEWLPVVKELLRPLQQSLPTLSINNKPSSPRRRAERRP